MRVKRRAERAAWYLLAMRHGADGLRVRAPRVASRWLGSGGGAVGAALLRMRVTPRADVRCGCAGASAWVCRPITLRHAAPSPASCRRSQRGMAVLRADNARAIAETLEKVAGKMGEADTDAD